MIDKLSKLFKHKATKEQKRIEIQKTGGYISNSMCYEAIELIPIILIDNAIKYSERRSTITLALSHTNSVTKVTVTSYGRPVPDEEIPRLFKRFFRGSNSLESSSTGLGIGLWVVRKILEAHNSSIEYNYENKLREFATNKFVFTLTANGLTR